MLIKLTTIALRLLLVTAVSLSTYAAKPLPSIKQCKSKWVLTSPQAQTFGAFVIEAGADTLAMDASGNVTTGGNATLSSSQPTSTFTVTIDNTRSRTLCGTYGFTLSWGVAPAPLAGPGTAMALTNVLASEPALLPTPTDISTPVTLFTANLPVTLTFQGDLATTFPQISGLYTSPAYTLDLIQSGRITSISNSTTATALTPLSIAETIAMDFGTVVGSGTASSVILNTTGGRSVTGGAQILTSGPGAAGAFQISGEAGLTYSTSITGPAILKKAVAPFEEIIANGFTHTSSGTVPAGGTETFQIGATLNLAPMQASGDYSTLTGGTPFYVTVNYN